MHRSSKQKMSTFIRACHLPYVTVQRLLQQSDLSFERLFCKGVAYISKDEQPFWTSPDTTERGGLVSSSKLIQNVWL